VREGRKTDSAHILSSGPFDQVQLLHCYISFKGLFPLAAPLLHEGIQRGDGWFD